MAKAIAKAVGSDVRSFLRSKNITVGERGLFKDEHVKMFNDAHKGVMRYERGNTKMIDLRVKVQSKTGKVRTEVKGFPAPVVREAAGKAGMRGPLSQADKDKAAEVLSVKVDA